MHIKGLEIQLIIYDSYSLKDKRRVLKSIMEKIRKRYNVSIAEIEDNEIWNKATLGVACVSNSLALCDQILNQVTNFIDQDQRVEITILEREG